MAELNSPDGISFDRQGNLYIADELNNVIRKVDTAGNISTVAGNGTGGFSGDGGPATKAELGAFRKQPLDSLKQGRQKAAGRQQCHAELEELFFLHTVDHYGERMFELTKVIVDTFDPSHKKVEREVVVRRDLFEFPKNEIEIKLRDLVVDDEDFLVFKLGLGMLKT